MKGSVWACRRGWACQARQACGQAGAEGIAADAAAAVRCKSGGRGRREGAEATPSTGAEDGMDKAGEQAGGEGLAGPWE